jgi:flagellar motor switch protein FliN/FliY
MSGDPHGPFQVEEFRDACQHGQSAAAAAFSQALDGQCTLSLAEVARYDGLQPPAAWKGAGWIFEFSWGATAVLGILPEASGLTPPWCAETGESVQERLRMLAVDLGAAFFSDIADSAGCAVTHCADLAGEVRRRVTARDGTCVSLALAKDGKSEGFSLVYPAKAAGRGEPDRANSNPAAAANATLAGLGRRRVAYRELDDGLRLLPPYSRSLLKISVPVTVILAESKQPLKAILDIGPGSIIHFHKSCEDTLTLEVAGHRFAVGETVKVGDKFGLWITSIILPDERFWVVGSREPAVRAK